MSLVATSLRTGRHSYAVRVSSRADAACYAFHTSGSTGKPKAVVGTRKALKAFFSWARFSSFPLGRSDCVLWSTSVAWDTSLWMTLWPHLVGTNIAVLEQGAEREVFSVVKGARESCATVMFNTPSQLLLLVALSPLSHLRQMFCGGEALPLTLARQFSTWSGTRLVNVYGPTECTVVVSSYTYRPDLCRHWGAQVGRAFANSAIALICSQMNVEGRGSVLIRGAQVCAGYYN